MTNDDYEIPIGNTLKTASEVGEILGYNANYIRKLKCTDKWGKKKYKAVCIDDGVDADKIYQKKYTMTHDRSAYFKERYMNGKRK